MFEQTNVYITYYGGPQWIMSYTILWEGPRGHMKKLVGGLLSKIVLAQPCLGFPEATPCVPRDDDG